MKKTREERDIEQTKDEHTKEKKRELYKSRGGGGGMRFFMRMQAMIWGMGTDIYSCRVCAFGKEGIGAADDE